ncbi:hypothetical protein, partial [Microcoleus sp. Aus8_D4]|uniref:hypothetical protein n=1 Tax=Microcoleus sp. Aus8_D4 TaxID=2818634 RepID=UPI002FD154E6
NNLHKFVGCRARPFWTGPTSHKNHQIVSYLILIPNKIGSFRMRVICFDEDSHSERSNLPFMLAFSTS